MPPAESPPVVEARGVTRAWGPIRALRGVDLTLERGEVLLLLGPNGAGKSTLLRSVAGLIRPSAGTIRILGRTLAPDDPAARRPIGLLSHQSLLYDDLTVLENLMLAARLYGLADPRELAENALRDQGLIDRRHDRPRSLSRGLLQRAAIARALIHEPALLLLDEPFTGLDAVAADRLRELLAVQLRTGRTMVLVTHFAGEAWELATRVGVLARGTWVLESPRPSDLAEFQRRYQELARG
jgi:ABC-type multidrug transport system ATPase subunit